VESHYDVVDAHSAGWNSDPFTLTGLDGYLYGRGVSDNKGPILAVAFAAAELLQQRSLEIELVFLIEGEEGTGSPGLQDALRTHKVMTTNISIVFLHLANVESYRTHRCHFGQVRVLHIFRHVIHLCAAVIRVGSQMTRLASPTA
jgi:hypothetical protein